MTRIHAATAALLLAAAVSCADDPTGPLLTEQPAPLLTLGTDFLACPSHDDRSVSGTIGLLGGTLAVDGHRFTVPALAVLSPTRFTMTAPASRFVEIEIHADGRDSFRFLIPAEVTISYDRCTASDIDPDALTVWHVDTMLGTLLEHMGGQADPEARTVTFGTDHLSGFIIAN